MKTVITDITAEPTAPQTTQAVQVPPACRMAAGTPLTWDQDRELMAETADTPTRSNMPVSAHLINAMGPSIADLRLVFLLYLLLLR